MKKILLFLLLIISIVSLVACGPKTEQAPKSGDSQKVEDTSTADEKGGAIHTSVQVSSKSGEETSSNPIESGEKKVAVVADPKRYESVDKNPIVTMEMSDGKIVKIELYPQIAPTTVENFISLINKKFYDGLIFHRVMPDFMAQGGDPKGNGIGGPGYSIKGEFSENGFTQNNLKHDLGVISMARATAPDSAGSQFFIVTADSESNHTSLDGKYAGFGKVIEGMDVVMEIVNSEVNFASSDLNPIYEKLMDPEPQLTNTEIALIQAYQAGEAFDRPINPPVIKKMTVETFGIDYAEPEKIN